MDINVKTKSISINKIIFENSFDQPLDCDLTMPDYCPDMKKILKCSVTPKIVSSRCVSDRLSVDADAQIRIIYLSEDNKLFCYEKTVDFSKNIELNEQIDNPCVEVNLQTSYVNTRAVSARRIDIYSCISVGAVISCKREESVVFDVENEKFEFMKDCDNVCSFVGQSVKNFNLNETIEIGETKSPIEQIVRVTSNVYNIETKAVSNKALLTGDLRVNILYLSSREENNLEIFEHTMPVSQLIDLEGISDKTMNYCQAFTNGVNVIAKENTNKEKKLLEIDASATAIIKAYVKIDDVFSSDCYSTKYDLKLSKKNVNIENVLEQINNSFTVKKNEKIAGIKISQIFDIWCENIKYTSSVKHGELNVNGTANICILGNDDSKIPFYIERPIEFDNLQKLNEVYDDCECSAFLKNVSVSYILSAEDSIEIRLEMEQKSFIKKLVKKELIESIEFDENNKKQRKSSFNIYFNDENDSLWDIAKKFNTTVSEIEKENDFLKKKNRQMIFIPVN